MGDYNVLIIDDEYTNLNAIKETLVEFGYKRQNIYPQATRDIREFSGKISNFAKEGKFIEMYFYIFKIIEDNNISALFVDLNHDKNKSGSNDRPGEGRKSSGERLILNLVNNKIHEGLPIVIYTRYAESDLNLNDVVGNHVGQNVISTEKAGNHFVVDHLVELFNKKGFQKQRIDRKVSQYISQRYRYNIAVVNALKLEIDPIERRLSDTKDNISCSSVIHNSKYGYIENADNGVILKILFHYMKDDNFGNYGPAETAQTINAIKDNCKAEYIVMTGVMGGVKKKVEIGTVVVAKESFEWDYARTPESKEYHERRVPHIGCSPTLEPHIKSLMQNKGDIQFGLIASGNSVINDEAKLNAIIKKKPETLGFEMEIYSLYNSLLRNDHIKTIAFKTVVDYGDGTKSKEHQVDGAQKSADEIFDFFLNYVYRRNT